MGTDREREALRQIQDIVREAKGSALDGEAVQRVQAVLSGLVGGAPAGATAYSRRDATILFADIRGFSALSASHPVDVVLEVLNACFASLTELVVRGCGTVDKFMGDALMAVFHGDADPPADHARRALLCAVEMQIAMQEVRERLVTRGLPELYLGIGVSTGAVMAGLIGSDAYRAYTVIGEEVNLASRLEALALRGQVLMSEATYARVKGFVQAGEPMELYVKGRARRLQVREALAVPSLGLTVPRQEQRKSPRVPVSLPLEYWQVEGKIVRRGPLRGQLHDLGYQGALAALSAPAPLYGELKLAFDLPTLGLRAAEIYARVVSLREERGEVHAGLEFTSLDAATSDSIRLFVQMLLQG